MAPTRKLSASDDYGLLKNPEVYQNLVSALKYLAFTRQDIIFSVNQDCHFMHGPRQTHLQVAKNVLRNTKPTISIGLVFPTVQKLINLIAT